MIRPVLKMGDIRLRELSRPVVQFGTPELLQLIVDMHDTMTSLSGAGLAAPQIGVPLRVVIFGGRANSRYPEAEVVPWTVLVNPVITPISDLKEEGWEGCLSVPGLRGSVPRWSELRYTGIDEYGNSIDRIATGFHARVVQHECDHLDGILYPERISNMKNFGFSEIFFPGQLEE